MPITIKTGAMKYKKPNGEYDGFNAIAQESTDQQIASIQTAGAAQVNAVQTTGAAQVSAVQQKGAETLDSIPDDYTELAGDVSSLKSAITNLANDIDNEISEELNEIRTVELSANLCDPTKLTVGYLSANGTIDPASNAYKTTDFIPVEVGESYSYAVFEDNGTVRVDRYLYLQYDSLRRPISATYNNSASVPGTTATISDQNVRYIRFCANQSLRRCMVVKSSSVPSTFVSYRKSVTNKMEIPELDAVEVLADETRTDLDGIETKVVSLNLIDPSKIEDGYIFTNSKQVSTDYSISGMIPIDRNTYYSYGNADQTYYNTGANKARYISFLDENQEYISNVQNASQFQTPASAVYVVLSFPINSRNVILLKGQYDFTQQNAVYIPYNTEYSIPISKVSGIGVVGKNLFDISKASLNSFLIVYPRVEANSMYFVTDYIPIENGQKYFVPHLRSYVIYDIAKQKTSGGNAAETNFVFTAPADGYFRCSGWMDEINQFQIEKGNSASEYEEYKKTFSSGIPLLNDSQVSQAGNILYRKKWAVCGDSFTNGSQEQVNITSGKYRGMKHVYPYIIGNRNEISVLKFFEGGRTLAFPAEPGTFTNSLTNPNADWYYRNIPADVDYITIYLGINDEHHAPGSSGGDGEDNTGKIPIGTINDSTTATYLGAWNVVLTWLISNRPNAHIGIIVTNGNQNKDEYRQGQIAIAEKYGIPYIDLNGDSRTPAMIRTSNPNIPSAIKTALIQKWAVDPSTNTHPNDEAHEFESTFIENFLRSI